MHKNYTGLLYISSVARFCTNAPCFDGHSRSMSHKNQSAVLLRSIISGTVHFLPIAIPCTLTYPSSRQTYPSARATYPSKRCGTGKVKLYQFRSFDFDFLLAAVPNHPHEVLTLLGRGTGDALVCKDSGHCPCGVGHDFIGIVLFLHLIAVCLILLFGGDSAVSCHPELSAGFCLTGGFRLGRDPNYSWGMDLTRI